MRNSLYVKVRIIEEARNRGMFAPLKIPLLEFGFVSSMKLRPQGSSAWVKSVEKEVFHLMEEFCCFAVHLQGSCAMVEIPIDLNE